MPDITVRIMPVVKPTKHDLQQLVQELV